MLFRSKKTKKNSPQRGVLKGNRPGGRLCRLEPLEDRRLLSAFDLSDYGAPYVDTTLGGTETNKEYSGITYSDVTDKIYIVDDQTEAIIRYDANGTNRYTITTSGFNDLEGIVHMSGTEFAIVEERDQTGNNEFHISIVDIQDNTTQINKGSLPASKILKLTNGDLNAGTGNQGLEGIAYVKPNGPFYVAKEVNRIQVFEVTDNGGGNTTVNKVQIDNVTDMVNPDFLETISDIFFTDKAGANQDEERLFMMSSNVNSSKVIMADMATTIKFDVVLSGQDPVEVDLVTEKWEGVTFTPGGFIMFTVGDEISGAGGKWRFRIYRNFTSLTPDAAPDVTEVLNVDGTSGNLADDLITDTTPTFTGTLTRGIFEDSVPINDAWVWLYANGSPIGSAVQVDTGEDPGENPGDYSITVPSALDLGDYEFTIKAGPSSSTIDADRSIASAPLGVVIHSSAVYSDLTGNGFVDFQDLTVLLANWNSDVDWARGNLSGTFDTPGIIDFNDLTLLLTAWTGPGPGCDGGA
ncbi:MAG: SdiA-regulated domain-containing protein [Planctomycetes bacterium]|nr:SdiA-regulated domain-containing protein [Planctomycetota bacterium]